MPPEKFERLYKQSKTVLFGARGFSLPEDWESIWALALRHNIDGLAHGVEASGRKFVVVQTVTGIDIYYEGRAMFSLYGNSDTKPIYCATR